MAFIMIYDEQPGYNNVCEARKYQADALTDYIEHHDKTKERKYYNIDDNMVFSIAPFDTTGLKGEYLDVYHFIKDDDTICLISCNFKKLSGLCGYINRTTGPL